MKDIGLFFSYWKTIFIVFIVVVFRGYAPAQCASVQAEYKTASAGTNKCGFLELCNPSTPPKYYLECETVSTGSAFWDTFQAGDNCADSDFQTGSIETTVTATYNSLDCSGQVSYSGIAQMQVSEIFCGGEDPYSTNESATMNPNTGIWSDGGTAFNDAGNLMSIVSGTISRTYSSQCTPTMQTLAQTGSGSLFDGYYTGLVAITGTTNLSDEFTDAMLRSKVISFIPQSYPAIWTTNYGASFGSAFYSLDGNHYSAGAGRMEYRFHITDCQLNTSYWVTWDQVTIYPNNNPAPSVQHMQEEVEGNGDPINGVYTSVHTVDVPGTPSTNTVDNIQVTYSAWNTPGF